MSLGQAEAGGLEERKKVLLEIIYSFSRSLERPTTALLHEYVLLCRLSLAEKSPRLREYIFHAYMRGPFSEQLRSDLEVLINFGLIAIKDSRLVVTSSGEELVHKLEEEKNLQDIRAASDEILKISGSPHAISEGIYTAFSKVDLGEMLSLP